METWRNPGLDWKWVGLSLVSPAPEKRKKPSGFKVALGGNEEHEDARPCGWQEITARTSASTLFATWKCPLAGCRPPSWFVETLRERFPLWSCEARNRGRRNSLALAQQRHWLPTWSNWAPRAFRVHCPPPDWRPRACIAQVSWFQLLAPSPKKYRWAPREHTNKVKQRKEARWSENLSIRAVPVTSFGRGGQPRTWSTLGIKGDLRPDAGLHY